MKTADASQLDGKRRRAFGWHCSRGVIDKNSIKKSDKTKCVSCMRCVAKCPHNARTVNGVMVSVAAMTIKKACTVRKECEVYL